METLKIGDVISHKVMPEPMIIIAVIKDIPGRGAILGRELDYKVRRPDGSDLYIYWEEIKEIISV